MYLEITNCSNCRETTVEQVRSQLSSKQITPLHNGIVRKIEKLGSYKNIPEKDKNLRNMKEESLVLQSPYLNDRVFHCSGVDRNSSRTLQRTNNRNEVRVEELLRELHNGCSGEQLGSNKTLPTA